MFSVAVPSVAFGQVVVQFGSTLKYRANASNPFIGMTWTTEIFDDSTWASGSYGIGYETGANGAQNLIQTSVPTTSVSVYTRAQFNVANPSSVQRITLGCDYDDGFVAWLNGVEIYRSPQMPAGSLAWNTPSGDHESSNGTSPNYLPLRDVTDLALPALVSGTNVLAIGVWNTGAGSSDLVVVPQLGLNLPTTVLRGPYLQSGGPDRVTVRWRTDVATPSRVVYGASPATLNSSVEDPTPASEHVITLTGLAPDTRYYYAVGTPTELLTGGDAATFFVTAPPEGTDKPTRIWVLGDSGTGYPVQFAVRDAYYAFTASRHTDLWLMLGDNAYPDGTDVDYQQHLFDVYPDMLRKSVLWPTMGNHELPSADSPSQTGPYYAIFSLPRNAEAGGVASGTEAYYSFNYGNIHFVVLDSADTDRSSNGAMLTWLQQDLAATDQDWVIAYWHQPPYSKGSHDSDTELELLEMRQNVVPILDAYGVDLTLSGHSHDYERTYLIDGHYGASNTFNASMQIDAGDGREDGDGAYHKPEIGAQPHTGIVHTVAGSSGGQGNGGPLNHPAMVISLDVQGSLVLDVTAHRLAAQFVDATGALRDHWTLLKGPCPDDPQDDADADGVCGNVDNCPTVSNPSQANADGDAFGDACDTCTDTDGDGRGNPGYPANTCALDNCPTVSNPSQANADGDATGDACDICTDTDGDGFGNPGYSANTCATDNCPTAANASQANADGDTTGDACDTCTDTDGDGRGNPGYPANTCATDNCPTVSNPTQANADGDSLGDACDACPLDAQNDADADTICGNVDNCPTVANTNQANADGDA
ncbi:MAG TPA: metallophosphoesterase, partial [Candidatus Polarisedimenticolaceae bacterium]|nr:metallophosphoesterase [Candidatus Polarisedimenticolaceae bacterium]